LDDETKIDRLIEIMNQKELQGRSLKIQRASVGRKLMEAEQMSRTEPSVFEMISSGNELIACLNSKC